MLRFVEYEYDVLATTTIIENGLDIPRANTIIVNRADRFGLAQLYQLRGRVEGASSTPTRISSSEPSHPHRSGAEAAEGAPGVQRAGRGLPVGGGRPRDPGGGGVPRHQAARTHRLAGIRPVLQMLERAVQELQGETVPERSPATLHLGVDIKVPERYLAEMGDRLALYKRVAGARDETEVDRLQAETEDRYGHLPPPGRNLFDLARLRLVADRAGVKTIDVAGERLQIRFHERPPVEPRRVLEMLARERGSLTPSGMMILPAPEKASERIQVVRSILEQVLGSPA